MAASPDERKDQQEALELVHRGVHWCRWCHGLVVSGWWRGEEKVERGSFVCLLESICGVGEGIERTEKGYYGGAQGWGVCLWCVCQKMTMSRASEGVAVSPPQPAAPEGCAAGVI